MLKNILQKPLTVTVIFVVVTLLGVTMTTQLPLDLYPAFEAPVLAVSTVYRMATPQEVEENVTRVIEKNIVNLSGLKEMTSTSKDSHSLIILKFDWGKSVDGVTNDLRDKLDMLAQQLPDDVDKPVIWKFDPGALPIMELTLKGDRNIDELYSLAEKTVSLELEQIAGVASVKLEGGADRVVQVDFIQNRLEAFNLSINQVRGILKSQNIQLGSGSITEGEYDYLIKTQGQYNSLEEIENTVLVSRGAGRGASGQEIFLKDVANVYMGYDDESSRIIINGEPGIKMEVIKRTEANTVEAAEEVKERVEKLNRTLPGDVELIILNDASVQVKKTLLEVLDSAKMGIIFAVIVLMFFLRQFRSTVIVAISIPVSIMITIAGLAFSGNTLNMLTLSGLLLGVGMIVDGSIVMLENIFEYRKKGVLLGPSAYLGAKEMAAPITGSILTSIFVFLPLIVFGDDLEIFGMLFEPMSMTIIIALTASLIVAVFLIPVLSGKVIKVYTRTQRPVKNPLLRGLDNGIEYILTKLDNAYKVAVQAAVKRKFLTIVLFGFVLGASIPVAKELGFEMMPGADEAAIQLDVELEPGTNLDVTEDLIRQLNYIIEEEAEGVQNTVLTIGQGGYSYKGSIKVILNELTERVDSADDIKEIFRSHMGDFPQAQFKFVSTDQAARMMGGEGIQIKVTGTDLGEVEKTVNDLTELIKKNSETISEISEDFEEGLPQVQITINRGKVYDLGLNIQTIAGEIRALVAGTDAGSYFDGEDDFAIKLRLREEDRSERIDLDKLFILNKTGQKIPLSSIAVLEDNNSPAAIKRLDQARIITISCSPFEGITSDVAQAELKRIVDEDLVKGEGVSIDFGGDMETMKAYLPTLLMIAFFAVLLVFAVMVSQFESLAAPFIIFASMPMMFIGIVGSHYLMGLPLSMFTIIGALMLAGIVVNNGIVLVDRINLFVKRGMSINEACVEASKTRLRPILMTTLTTILAMVPMAYFPNAGGEMIQPLGVTVTAGLAVNTVITLFLVPALYSLFIRKKVKVYE